MHEFKIGDWVRALRKTSSPESWEDFLKEFPNRVFTVKTENGIFTTINSRISPVGCYTFRLTDLEPYTGPFICDHAGECLYYTCSHSKKHQWDKTEVPCHDQCEFIPNSKCIPCPEETKEIPMKYKKGDKPLTLAAMKAEHPCATGFAKLYTHFAGKGVYWDSELPLDEFINLSEEIDKCAWPLEKGFLVKEEEEKTFRSGQHFKTSTGEEYVLSWVSMSPNLICFVNVKNGSRLSDAAVVEDPHNLTPSDIARAMIEGGWKLGRNVYLKQ